MKKIILLVISLCVLFVLTACGQPEITGYHIDENGKLIATYEDNTTADLGTLSDTIANGANTITVNAEGHYVINGVVSKIKANLPESYTIDTSGNLIVTYTDTTTKNLGKFGKDAINTIESVGISDNGFYILNGIATTIEAILPESYAIDINGNLIVTYTDATTENLGKFGNDAINTIDTISISDDGFYVLNGIKTNIVAVDVFEVNFVTGYSTTVKTQVIKDGDKVERPQIERDGYTLVGWYCNGEEWRFNSDVVLNEMTLTAEWAPNTYSITFNSNGGNDIQATNIKTGETLNLPTPKRDLYTFDGWYFNGLKITDATAFDYATNLELVAEWHRTQYEVSFDTAGGNVLSALKVDSFSQITELPTPSKQEFEFLGWYANENKIELPFDFTEGDLTLTAHWRGISEDWEFIEDDAGTGIKLLNYKGNATEVVIPKTLGGKAITTIQSNCFKDNDNIISINFHHDVVNFGFKSISNCNGLKSIIISSDLEIDIVYLFGGEANIPNSLTDIYFCAGSINANSSIFNNLTTRKFELWTNNDLKVLKEDAFYRCNAITKLHLNEGLTKIETTAISDMDYLTYVNIPSTVVDVGWSNFGNCPQLLYLIAPKTIKYTTHQSLVASGSVVLVEYETIPSTWDSTTFGYDTTSSKMNIFYGFEKLVETEDFLYALCKVGNTKRCIIIQRYDSTAEYPEFIEDYPVTFTNNSYTKAK